jgi:hypothetical protein
LLYVREPPLNRAFIFVVPIAVLSIGIPVLGWYATTIKPIDDAEDAVRLELIDPDSAKFRNVKLTETETICGEVNAKNKTGEYLGFRYFYVSSLTGERTVWLDSDTFSLAKQMCTKE